MSDAHDDRLYEAWAEAQLAAATAQVKALKTRRAAEAAERGYERARLAQDVAFQRWRDARESQ